MKAVAVAAPRNRAMQCRLKILPPVKAAFFWATQSTERNIVPAENP